MNFDEDKRVVMNDVLDTVADKNIEDRIYVVRGKQVMLDRDLAELYGVETKRLNEQVRRNFERFPDDFMFQMTKEECLRSRIATLNEGRGRHLKYMPYAFTENGIAMLSSVLRSETAIAVNIRIMRAFTQLRANSRHLFDFLQRIETVEYNQLELNMRVSDAHRKIEAVFDKMKESENWSRQGIFYDGQTFDAYSFISGLIRSARQSIVLIDNYVDDTVLLMLSKRRVGVSAVIYTKGISEQLKVDIMKHDSQYAPIDVMPFNKSHDRFLMIDDAVYHIGASLKDLGKRWFAFTRMNDLSAAEIVAKTKI